MDDADSAPAGHPRSRLPAPPGRGGQRRARCSRPWSATAGARFAAGDAAGRGRPARRGARALARQPAGRRPGHAAGRGGGRTAGRAAPGRRRAADHRGAGLRRARPGHTRAAQAAGRPSAAGRPVAAADAGAGRRGPPRGGARRLRPGADRHRRSSSASIPAPSCASSTPTCSRRTSMLGQGQPVEPRRAASRPARSRPAAGPAGVAAPGYRGRPAIPRSVPGPGPAARRHRRLHRPR